MRSLCLNVWVPEDPGESVESPGEEFMSIKPNWCVLAEMYRERRCPRLLEPASSNWPFKKGTEMNKFLKNHWYLSKNNIIFVPLSSTRCSFIHHIFWTNQDQHIWLYVTCFFLNTNFISKDFLFLFLENVFDKILSQKYISIFYFDLKRNKSNKLCTPG